MTKSVAIGIPAYNEEKNINSLLRSLTSQKDKTFEIKKIIVADDGSTDNTIAQAKKIKDTRILILSGKRRLGKASRLNQMYKKFNEDIFLQFDADVQIKDKELIKKMIEPFIKNPDLGIVFGAQIPMKPRSFIGCLAYFGFYCWEKAKASSKKNVERYNCFGQITAFSKSFLNNYWIPEERYVTEDTYSFYFAKKNHFDTFFNNNACVFFKLPENFHDYRHQMSRYLSTRQDMEKIFGDKLISQYETIDTNAKLKGLIENTTVNNIHIAVSYLFLQIITKIQNNLSNQKIQWVTIQSSK